MTCITHTKHRHSIVISIALAFLYIVLVFSWQFLVIGLVHFLHASVTGRHAHQHLPFTIMARGRAVRSTQGNSQRSRRNESPEPSQDEERSAQESGDENMNEPDEGAVRLSPLFQRNV